MPSEPYAGTQNASMPNIHFFYVFLAALSLLVYVIAAKLDLLEQVLLFSNAHEEWELDEMLVVFVFLGFAFLFVSVRQLYYARIVEKQLSLKNQELEKAMSEIKQLRGIIPICVSCKKIRDDIGLWQHLEAYMSAHTDALFSHSLCPDCSRKLYPDLQSDKP